MSATTRSNVIGQSFGACALAVFLAACGGGGGGAASGGCTTIDPARSSSLPGCASPTPTPTPTPPPSSALAPLALTLADSAGAAMTTVTPERPGVLRATVRDTTGAAVPNIAVTFSSTDKSGSFVPASGTALTDSTGVASVGLPAGALAGGYTATAIAVRAKETVTGTVGYATAFPALSFSALRISPAPLSAGGTASIAVTVQAGGSAYLPSQVVTFTSACAAAGKASIGATATSSAGVASTTYTDKGCGALDTITASTMLGGATVSQAATLQVLPAAAGQLNFISASPTNISLIGTGGPGRQESSIVTFRTLSPAGIAVSGVTVDFSLFGIPAGAATGGITVLPASAVTGPDGTVTTVVTAGTVNTPVRVMASVRGAAPAVTSVSDQLVVSTGIANQNSFSLSTRIINVEGWNHDGCEANAGSEIRVSLADHFNNPVPDGTAVSFTAEGGAVGASCLTGGAAGKGVCTVNFCSAAPRPADGRVSVMAYTLGEESYTENSALSNSINRYDVGELFDDLCEPFRDDAAVMSPNSTLRDSKLSACPAPAASEIYIDTNGNGRYDATGDGVYNGVLNVDPATGRTLANSRSSTVHVRRSLVQVLSGSTAKFTAISPAPLELSKCVDGIPFVNTQQAFTVAVRDNNPTIFAGNTLSGNILPAGTVITFSTNNGSLVGGDVSYTVPNSGEVSEQIWYRTVLVRSDATQSGPTATPPYACTNPITSGTISVKVTTPKGIVTSTGYGVND